MNDPDEQNDPIWNLLGKAPNAKPSLRFAADVVRAVREEEGRRKKLDWRRWILGPAGAVAFAGLMVWFAVQTTDSVPSVNRSSLASAGIESSEPMAEPEIEAEDIELIVELDILLAQEENSLWIEEPSSYF